MARPNLIEIERRQRASCTIPAAELDAMAASSGALPFEHPTVRRYVQAISGVLEQEARFFATRNRAACEAAYRGEAA
jgi:hypothetical protein